MVDIRVSGLVKSFDLEKRILDGLTFQVDSGERVACWVKTVRARPRCSVCSPGN